MSLRDEVDYDDGDEPCGKFEDCAGCKFRFATTDTCSNCDVGEFFDEDDMDDLSTIFNR